MITKLPKKIKEGDIIYDLECKISTGKDIVYMISYINVDEKMCAFLVISRNTGFDYNEMLRKLNEDVNWVEC